MTAGTRTPAKAIESLYEWAEFQVVGLRARPRGWMGAGWATAVRYIVLELWKSSLVLVVVGPPVVFCTI